MVQISIAYTGGLHCEAQHGPSQVTLQTDAPVDNCGKGESFSPTDLVATALGTCIATTMAIFAQRKGVELAGTRLEVTKEMTQSGPRRIARLATKIWFPAGLARETALEHAAETCPVHQSLHPEVLRPIEFHWAE